MRIAWFSPLPPSRSGIAAYTAEVVPLLRERLLSIDLFIDPTGIGAPFPTGRVGAPEWPARPAVQQDAPPHRAPRTPHPAPRTAHPAPRPPHVFCAHDFVWRHRRAPYDLTVYQLGNAECHNYMWAYLFRFPGLVVLHDAQLHQSRALWLLKRLEPRRDDYFAELSANHPGAPANLGELVAAGLGGSLYQHWPMLDLVLRASRLTLVHNQRLAASLREQHPDASIDAIPMGVRDLGLPTPDSRLPAGGGLRSRLGIPEGAIVIAAYGGITPEKRIPQLLRAVAALGERTPPVHVLLVGATADHYDIAADARACGLETRVHLAGYVPDEELPAWMHAADIVSCLRWPTNRETSASWLRCLAAGRPTLITKLSELADVPEDVAIPIDVVDEDTVLPGALARLIGDEALRRAIGARARAWWAGHHQLDAMAGAYEAAIATASARPVPHALLPPHLRNEGSAAAEALLAPMGISLAQAGL